MTAPSTRTQVRDRVRLGALATMDFTTGEHLRNLKAVPSTALLTGNAPLDSAGLPILQRGTTNYLVNSGQFFATPGVTGAGGALGPGWEQGNSVVPLTVLAASANSVTLQLGPFPSFQSVTIRSRTSAPFDPTVVCAARGGAAFSATVSVDAASSPSASVFVGHNILTPSNTFKTGRANLNAGQSARLTTWAAQADLGTGFVSHVGVTAGTTAVVILTITNPQLESASSVRDATDFTAATTRSASTAALSGLPDGAYKVLVNGATEDVWLTATSASGSCPLDAGSNGSLHVSKLYALPAALDVSEHAEILNSTRYKDFFSSAPTTTAPIDPSWNRLPFNWLMNRIENGYSSAVATNRPPRFRFEVRPGDNLPVDAANGNTNERSEFYNAVDKAAWDTDTWVSYAFKIHNPPISADPSNDFRIIQQWRYNPNSGETTALSPDVAVYLTDDGTLNFTTRTGPVGQTTTPATDHNPLSVASPATVIRWTAANLVIGKWHFLTYRIRFSETDGYLEAYLDGTKMFDHAAAIGYTRDVGPTFRTGIYRHAHPSETTVVEIANLEIGTASLAARVAAPLLP